MLDKENDTEYDDAALQPEDDAMGSEGIAGPSAEEEQAVSEYKEKLVAALHEAEEVKLRCLAEMDNYKKRLQREKEEQAAYAAEKILTDILPTLDNFDLALQYGAQAPEACKDMLVGLEMTRGMLLDVLKKHGLSPVGEVGQPFDPNDHEAVSNETDSGVEQGRITRVLQKGYRLGSRLLRPARVIVAA